MPTFRNTLFHLRRRIGIEIYIYPPMKMEETECSETSAYKIQTPANYPEEIIQHSEHGESLISGILYLLVESNCTKWCAQVVSKEMLFAINGVNPSTDLEVVRAHTHIHTHTHTHTHTNTARWVK